MTGVALHCHGGQAGQPTLGGPCSHGVPPSPTGMLGVGDSSQGQGKALRGRPEAWVRGMTQGPCCVTLGKAYPSLSLFPPW